MFCAHNSSNEEPTETDIGIDTIELRNMIDPLQQASRSLYLPLSPASAPNLANESDTVQPNNIERGGAKLNDVFSASELTIHYNLPRTASESGSNHGVSTTWLTRR